MDLMMTPQRDQTGQNIIYETSATEGLSVKGILDEGGAQVKTDSNSVIQAPQEMDVFIERCSFIIQEDANSAHAQVKGWSTSCECIVIHIYEMKEY